MTYEWSVFGGREERGCKGDVLDVAAGKLYPAREPVEINVVVERSLRWKCGLPDKPAILLIWKRELDDEAHSADECFVHVLAQIRRQNSDALILFHLLQQVADLDIGVAVVSVLDFRPLAEQRVRLVEKQNRVARLRRVENPTRVVFPSRRCTC